MLRSSCTLVGLVALSLAACSVYDESLLAGAGGSGGDGLSSSSSTDSSSSTGGGGQGGGDVTGCTVPADCPTPSNACQVATCENGTCGVADVASGTAVADPTPGDCKRAECDGGSVRLVDDDSDSDDGNECTTDTCDGGVATHTVTENAACGTGGTCNAAGLCVECATGADCPSGVCSPSYKCLEAACDDHVKNGDESDIDCGGSCGPCAVGSACGDASDCDATGDNACRTHACTDSVCAYDVKAPGTAVDDPTPGDCQRSECGEAGAIVSVADDTDLAASATACVIPVCTSGAPSTSFADTETMCDDGGGAVCNGAGKCVVCNTTADCDAEHVCGAGSCIPRLVISEFRSRGPGGGNDDFIELYNPTSAPITLDSKWQLRARSDGAGDYDTVAKRRWVGSGEVIPSHGHLLIGGSAYGGAAPRDAVLGTGITESGSLILEYGADPLASAVIDAICYYRGDTAKNKIADPSNSYICEGNLVENPHTSTNVDDKSLERKPGGAAGNGTDTGDNAADFQVATPSNPQNLASAVTP